MHQRTILDTILDCRIYVYSLVLNLSSCLSLLSSLIGLKCLSTHLLAKLRECSSKAVIMIFIITYNLIRVR